MTTRPPVLVLAPPGYLGPLGMMRSLARWGVHVFALAHHSLSLANVSRYCRGKVEAGDDGRPLSQPPQRILDDLLGAGRRLGEGTVLVAGSDEWALFVAEHAAQLAEAFRFPRVAPSLVLELGSKVGLQRLAERHGVPTPQVVFPSSVDELGEISRSLQYPVMLKPVLSRPGLTVLLASGRDELLTRFTGVKQPQNMMIQEYIPGGDGAVWMFDGYFDAGSRCLFGLTGQKIRQHPAKMGICSFGICTYNEDVVALTTRFLSEVGYHGLVDIGYRYDRRDGRYKILDVNPRLGGAFRLFVDGQGLDVARAMYMDLCGENVPPAVRNDGRRWLFEVADLIAFKHYRQLDGLRTLDWVRSLREADEMATFAWSDPAPFAVSLAAFVQGTVAGRWRHRVIRRRSAEAVRGS